MSQPTITRDTQSSASTPGLESTRESLSGPVSRNATPSPSDFVKPRPKPKIRLPGRSPISGGINHTQTPQHSNGDSSTFVACPTSQSTNLFTLLSAGDSANQARNSEESQSSTSNSGAQPFGFTIRPATTRVSPGTFGDASVGEKPNSSPETNSILAQPAETRDSKASVFSTHGAFSTSANSPTAFRSSGISTNGGLFGFLNEVNATPRYIPLAWKAIRLTILILPSFRNLQKIHPGLARLSLNNRQKSRKKTSVEIHLLSQYQYPT